MAKDYEISSRPQELVTKDIQRNHYDLSHWDYVCGEIGRLQTLSCIPVVAGDSFEVNVSAVVRLSPLRHYMYLDAVVDLFAFYVPHRHIYGSDWTTFIKSGTDEAVTFGGQAYTGSNRLGCTGYPYSAALTVPKWNPIGYINIWNRYFADPQISGDQKATTYFTTLSYPDKTLQYGIPCCFLKRSWNTGIYSNIDSSDYRVALESSEVNLYTFAQQQARLKTEQARDWFAAQRYTDILKYTWDTMVNIDADQRPELVMRKRAWLSGQDVDGTDQASLGYYTGKSAGLVGMQIPSKFFPEHGALWIMALVRFPAVLGFEVGYLGLKSEPSYKEIAGDPMLISNEKPHALVANTVFAGAGSTALGDVPYAQWYREHPNNVHTQFLEVSGHPFPQTGAWTTRGEYTYIDPTDFDSVFANTSLAHWQIQAYVDCQAKRFIPKPEDSIFAGTN